MSILYNTLGGIYTYVVALLTSEVGWHNAKNGTEQSYIDSMNAAAPSWLLVVILGTLLIKPPLVHGLVAER